MGLPQSLFNFGFGFSNIDGAFNTRTVTGSASLTSSDNIIYVNNTSGNPITITSPATPATNQVLIIKDVAGNANSENITFAGTVDGNANPVIGANYGGVFLTWNGSSWSEHA